MISQEPATLIELQRFAAKHRQSTHNLRRLASDLELLLHSGKPTGKAKDACAMVCRAAQDAEEQAAQIDRALKWVK